MTTKLRHGPSASAMDRRHFLRAASVLVAGVGLSRATAAPTTAPAPTAPSATARLGWQLSVQHYTYRRFSLFEAMDLAATVGLRHFEVRSNLKLGPKWPGLNANESMPAEALREFKSRVADLGLSLPSVFADFDGTPDQAKRLLAFWRELGTEIVVAEPDVKSLDMLEKLCEEHRMRLALHNHQKGKSYYWSPEVVLAACANRSKRIGACADVGQWARSGLDPVDCLRKLACRIHGFHLKDVLKKGDLDSRNTVMGEGQADCGGALEELKRQGYRGPVAIDFEHDTPALQDDMAKNIAFVQNHADRLQAG